MPDFARYLRVSLINECNLSCFYCKPAGTSGQPVKRISLSDIIKAVSLLHKLGVRKIRFTGGEPTLFKELPQLVSYAKSLSEDMHVAVTSNGLLLDRRAQSLAEAGLDSVNISLDTTDRDKFISITGVDKLDQVLKGIETTIKHVALVKLNCVVMAGINDHEAENMIRLADTLGIDIRFIEYMPTRQSTNFSERFVSGETLRNSLPFELIPVQGDSSAAARYYRTDRLRINIGFIEPVSHSFCANCNRIRLDSDGHLFGCLFSDRNINLVKALEDGEESALQQVHQLLAAKEFLGCTFDNRTDNLPSFMNIGG